MKKNKNVLLGVCGGISAYKTCDLVRLLTQADYNVKVMMTPASTKFVTSLVFESLTGKPVYIDMFEPAREDIQHISLAQWAHLCVIAPLSANTLSKIANGICDNLLTTVVCAQRPDTPVILAPAMNENMWKNPLIQKNLAELKKLKKYIIIAPQKGKLACGMYGEGRMAEPRQIFRKIESIT